MVVSPTGDCLLCDFGFSLIKYEISYSQSNAPHGGHERFVAPEISSGTVLRVNEKSDVYSLAMTIYTLGTRSPPFAHPNKFAACTAAQKGERPQKCNSLGGFSTEETSLAWSLMERMWNHVPRDRPTVASARDRMVEISLMHVQSTIAPLPSISTSVCPSKLTSTHGTNRFSQVSALSNAESPISDARLMLRYASYPYKLHLILK